MILIQTIQRYFAYIMYVKDSNKSVDRIIITTISISPLLKYDSQRLMVVI